MEIFPICQQFIQSQILFYQLLLSQKLLGEFLLRDVQCQNLLFQTNHGGSREIIENNVTGWLVEPNNPEDLANKIIYVLNLNQRKKDLIGQNAQKKN